MEAYNSFQLLPPKWLLYAVPVACLSASYLVIVNRRNLLCLAYDLIVKVGQPRGKPYLSGNCAPIDDERFEDLQVVEGKLPDGLDGCYVRNGPNPFFKPVAGYHWFDGDGMLHAVRLRSGKATYCNRYVETERLQQERHAGRPLYLRLGDVCGLRGLMVVLWDAFAKKVGGLTNGKGTGTANTALVYHAGRLLALEEGDLPYGIRVLCNGLVETMGRLQMDRSWRTSFTAHPKVDPENGDMMFIGYKMDSKPYVRAGIMDAYGNLMRQWNVDLARGVMMHDMAATQHYILLLDMPLCFDPEAMIKENSVPLKLHKEYPSRFGLLRRDQPGSRPDGVAEVQWFALPGPGFMIFHLANAWEDDNGDVKLYACQMDDLNLNLDNMKRTEIGRMTEYTMSPSTGKITSRRITEVAGDFPVVHPGKATRKCKWAWIAMMELNATPPIFNGIAKLDLEAAPGTDACVAMIKYPAGMYAGEAVFVPCAGAATEDSGYLMVYVHDTKADISYMHIYDARTMSPTPVTSLRIPHRVPYGFHGAWVTEQQLKKQVMWL